MKRTLAWFSCGSASACAAKLAIERWGKEVEVCYCDTLAYEHPDNRRFIADCERWFGQTVKILSNPNYSDIYDVFLRTRWLVGPQGARCTTELKKNVRKAYQQVDDRHVFGFTADEMHRVERFRQENPELIADFPLVDAGMTKGDCHAMVEAAGIPQPMMYRLGYRNNNCVGCVKGGIGYWNKIRRDFPETFNRMARVERVLQTAILRREIKVDGKRVKERVFLDELDPRLGRYSSEPSIGCGVLCDGGNSTSSE